MTKLAASMVRLWVRLYTATLEVTVRNRIRQEVEADLWEQMNGKDVSSKPAKEAVTMILRLILGIPADAQRMVEESSLRGFSMRAKKVSGVVAQRRFWLTLLAVSGFILSLLFLGIGTFIIAGILVCLWPGSRRLQQALDRL